MIEIYRSCERCNGTGEVPNTPIQGGGGSPSTCPDCEGTGKMKFADINDLEDTLSDLDDKLDDILGKCNDILEKVSE